jgi:hypothetical protein
MSYDFPIVRKMSDLMLTRKLSGPSDSVEVATNEWGLRTPDRKKLGGKPLCIKLHVESFQQTHSAPKQGDNSSTQEISIKENISR